MNLSWNHGAIGNKGTEVVHLESPVSVLENNRVSENSVSIFNENLEQTNNHSLKENNSYHFNSSTKKEQSFLLEEANHTIDLYRTNTESKSHPIEISYDGPKPKMNLWAMSGFVLGLLSFIGIVGFLPLFFLSPIGFIVSIIGIAKTPKKSRDKKLAIIGLILSLITIGGVIAIIIMLS
ncbi:MAG: hypothetical protein ACOVP1_03455 [Bacteroidia bacterium]